jgi:hypothetical protein
MNANTVRAAAHTNDAALVRGISIGAIGGVVGTIVMDLFCAAMFLAMGEPASLTFSIIGDAAAAFFAMLGVTMPGGAPLGALLHYLIGLVFGGILGFAVLRIRALRADSLKKGIALGILFVEVMSQPLLVAAAIVLKMTPSQTAQWFGVSFTMHLAYGGVLGAIVARAK